MRICDWCNERIEHVPFKRTVADEVFFYCTNDCLHKHWKFQCDGERMQSRFANL